MATPPPPALEPPVQALILDIDGTLKGSFDPSALRVTLGIQRLAQSRAQARGLDAAALEDQVWTEAAQSNVGLWLNRNVALLGEMLPCLKAGPAEDFADADAQIGHQFQRERDQSLQLFEGVETVIAQARAAGAAVIIHTDAQPSRVIHEFHRMGVDLDQIDEIHTAQENTAAPALPIDTAETAYGERLREKLATHAQVKPNPAVVQSILARWQLDPAHTLFVGDHAADGLTAGGAGVAFAWQKAGGTVLPQTERLQQRLVGDRYPLGPAPQEARLRKEGCWPPSIILNEGFHQLARLTYARAPGREAGDRLAAMDVARSAAPSAPGLG